MKQKLLLMLASVLLLCQTLGTRAQTTDYAITVNGTVLEQQVKEVSLFTTYNNNYYVPQNIIRLWGQNEDRTWWHIDLHPLQVEIIFGNDVVDGVDKIKMFDGGIIQDKLKLEGLPAGTRVMIFNANGHLCLQGLTTEGNTAIDLDTLPKGIYVAKAGKTVFKFVKN